MDPGARAAFSGCPNGIAVCRDPVSQYRFITASPSSAPDIWHEYLDGALKAYTKFGAESALEYDRVVSGRSTALFSAALDEQGTVVGGLRAQGPFLSADESHALKEWQDAEQVARIRASIEAKVPFGIIEAKAAWIGEGVSRRRELALAVATMGANFMQVLGARYMMATAADTVLDLWRTCGGAVDESVPPTPYPDRRYRTRLMWWDSAGSPRTLSVVAEPSWKFEWNPHDAGT
ncbi:MULTISPECIES: hypothetical protein [Rhodococcus]|uniref:hypothetical protein n=1 Tax=Rhodococcus TaxID=1827 RepID=UPI001179B5D0|nr:MULTISPECIES: hypothetical protein [Rhodococcus]